jgi:hypothetical protein
MRSGPLTAILLGVRIVPETSMQGWRRPVADLLVEHSHPAKIRTAGKILRDDGPELAAGCLHWASRTRIPHRQRSVDAPARTNRPDPRTRRRGSRRAPENLPPDA